MDLPCHHSTVLRENVINHRIYLQSRHATKRKGTRWAICFPCSRANELKLTSAFTQGGSQVLSITSGFPSPRRWSMLRWSLCEVCYFDSFALKRRSQLEDISKQMIHTSTIECDWLKSSQTISCTTMVHFNFEFDRCC
jgi:hypothetical protein